MQDPTKLLRSWNKVGPIKDSLCLPSLSAPIHAVQEAAQRTASTRGPPPFVDSFLDGCGEAGEAQGILNGSNFVATHYNFVATSLGVACRKIHRKKSCFGSTFAFGLRVAPLWGALTSLHARSDEVAMKLLRSCNELVTKLDHEGFLVPHQLHL